MKNLLNLGLFVALAAIFAVSCNNAEQGAEGADTSANEEQTEEFTTRSLTSKKIAAEYSYKSLATFERGAALNNMDMSKLADLQGKKVNLVVLYDSEAPWADVFNSGDVSKTGDDTFNGLMSSYSLVITKQFELDDMNEGLVLEPNGAIDNPVEAARELSMVDYVMMVHVKEVPAEDTNTDETASTN